MGNMKFGFYRGLLLVFGFLWLASSTFAAKDQYLGDASIYAGVPTNMELPYVLFVIDNSSSTLNFAPGVRYSSGRVYEQKAGCNGVSRPGDDCYLPWIIYKIDNQGDAANSPVLVATSYSLPELTCTNNGDIIRRTLQLRGTYSGSGTSTYPNIANGGGCSVPQNPSGEVYALGNYLNYTQTAEAALPPAPAGTPANCLLPDPVVKVTRTLTETLTEQYCDKPNTTLDKCPKPNVKERVVTRQTVVTSYYQLKKTHTASVVSEPGAGASWQLFWNEISPNDPLVTATPLPTVWASGTDYTITVDRIETSGTETKSCQLWLGPAPEPDPDQIVLTQREVMYQALEQAIGGALGAVKFGAMVYGANNSGGKLLYGVSDLSAGYNLTYTEVNGEQVPVPPDCDAPENATLPYCQFLNVLPGMRNATAGTGPFTKSECSGKFNGEDCVSSNTGRPQSEALFDAGFYYGAFPNLSKGVSNTTRLGTQQPCGANHIVLLTNGFSNGDGNDTLRLVGDADGDRYLNGAELESSNDKPAYGSGSHWLDDVARYLKVNNLETDPTKLPKHITTHTVLAFQSDDDLIRNAAQDGGGRYYQAYNAQQLASALTKLLAGIINEKSTSFVAPVVPASTTNRTISSSKVYLGLFRPQAEGEAWRGNVKKYSVSSSDSNQLLAYDGSDATYPDGSFKRDSISNWSLYPPGAAINNGVVPSARGDLDPDGTDANKPKGDGGEVDAGGLGGLILKKVESIAAAVRSTHNWGQTTVPWRKIVTYTGSSRELMHASNAFSLGNTTQITDALLGLDGSVVNEPARANLIRFIHGFIDDPTDNADLAQSRSWVMGDVLHSRPQVVNYNRYPATAESVCDPSAANGYNGSVIYVGANDGMLHAFRDCDGQELWAFIPPSALSGLKYFMRPGDGHPTFVDGPPSFFKWDANNNGIIETGDRVVLLFGQRRGGGKNLLDNSSRGSYFGLEVTDPANPKFLWELDSSIAPELGETWSQPMTAKIRLADVTDTSTGITTKKVKELMFVGAGYDNIEDLRYGNVQTFRNPAGVNLNTLTGRLGAGGSVDGSTEDTSVTDGLTTDSLTGVPLPRGRGIYAVEVATLTKVGTGATSVVVNESPTIYWSYTSEHNSSMDFSFASDLTVLDLNGNGYADRIYAGDTGGNLWRFDISGPTPDDPQNPWQGEILFKANPGSDGSNGRKIFYSPAVAFAGAPFVYFGTGDREHPLNKAVIDRLYCVVDWKDVEADKGLTTSKAGNYPLNEASLVDVTENLLQDTKSLSDTTDSDYINLKKQIYSSPYTPYDTSGNYRYGWFIKMDGCDRQTIGSCTPEKGEKILAQPEIFGGGVYFNTYRPTTGSSSTCEAGNLGLSTGYTVDYRTGEALYDFDKTNNAELNDLTEAEVQAQYNERAIGATGELLQRTDRARALGTGIPSGAVIIVGADGKVKLIMSSSEKVSVFEGVSTKAVHPIYWMQW